MAEIRSHYLALTVVLFTFGFLAALAYRSNFSVSTASSSTDRHEQLVQIVVNLERKKESLLTELDRLREDIGEQEREEAARRGLSQSYTAELERLRMLAGLVPVRGPGVTVTLADNQQPPENAVDANNYIIHDYDVRTIANALWVGGAEAVSVNGERLVQSSAIRCVGTTVLVNSTRVGSPFVISAVGDPQALLDALETDKDARLLLHDYVRAFGLKVAVSRVDEVQIPPYRGSLSPRSLRAVQSGAS